VELRQGDAQRLPLPGASVDSVVATYALCSMPDPLAVLTEARRVLRPGGRLVLVEHGAAAAPAVRLLQRAAQPFSVRFAADDLLGDPIALLPSAGFGLLHADRAGRGRMVFRLVAQAPAS
jgi:SAM-dependent methyltransferase